MNKILNKILENRLTDVQLKLLLLISVIAIAGNLLYFWTYIKDLDSKWYEIAKKKEIIVMDEAGNVWQKKMYSNKQDIAVLFGQSFIKNTFTYNYKNYNEVKNYISNLVSSKDTKTVITNEIIDNLENLTLINGQYNVSISNYIITQKEENFEGVFLITHSLTSSTDKINQQFIINLEIEMGAPTVNNSSGYYIKSLKKELYDPETNGKVFNKGD